MGRDHDAMSRDFRILKLARRFRFYCCKYEKYRNRKFPLTEPCGYRHFDKYLFKRHVLTRLTAGTSTSTSPEIQGLVRVLVFVVLEVRAACTSYKPGTSLCFSSTENYVFY